MSKPSTMTVRSKRPPPVLVCRKCLRRSDEGDAIRRALKRDLKRQAKVTGGKRARLVLTDCFGLCPKRAVVTATAESLSRGEFVLIRDGDGSRDD